MSEKRVRLITTINVGLTIIAVVAVAGLWLRVIKLENMLFNPQNRGVGQKIGEPLPDFVMADTNGKEVSLNDLKDKPFLIVFSSLTCPYCKRLNPELSKFSINCSALSIIMVTDGNKDQNEQLLTEHNFGFPVLSSGNNESHKEAFGAKFEIIGTPWLYYVNDKGIIIEEGSAQTENDLIGFVKKAGFTGCE